VSLSNCFPLSEIKTLDAEAVNNVLLDEASDILLRDSGQGFCLDPFSEVIDSYDEELKLPHCYGERFHYVKPLLGEWPGSVHWGKLLQWLPYDVAEALTFVARLYIGLGVLLHSGPIVSYSYKLVD